jgi:hypothetical protein
MKTIQGLFLHLWILPPAPRDHRALHRDHPPPADTGLHIVLCAESVGESGDGPLKNVQLKGIELFVLSIFDKCEKDNGGNRIYI